MEIVWKCDLVRKSRINMFELVCLNKEHPAGFFGICVSVYVHQRLPMYNCIPSFSTFIDTSIFEHMLGIHKFRRSVRISFGNGQIAAPRDHRIIVITIILPVCYTPPAGLLLHCSLRSQFVDVIF
jgi:hypothetical protein